MLIILTAPPVRRERGDTAAFVIGPAPDGPSEATGLWYGPLSGQPAKIERPGPRHQPGLRAPRAPGSRWPCRTARAARLIVADPAGRAGRAGRATALPVFAEQVAWTDGRADRAGRRSRCRRRVAHLGQAAAPARPGPGRCPGRGRLVRRLWRVDAGHRDSRPGQPGRPGGLGVRAGSRRRRGRGRQRRPDRGRLVSLQAGSSWTRGGPAAGCCWSRPGSCPAPAVSPDGRVVAYVEGWASDRGLLAGEVRLLRPGRQARPRPARLAPLHADLDVTWLCWAADGRLWLAGWHHLGHRVGLGRASRDGRLARP